MISANNYSSTIYCGLILYNPESEIIKKIKEYSRTFQKVFVFDNSESLDKATINAILSIDSVVYLTEGKNIGLPSAYNKILEKIGSEADYLCCLDQDSIFPKKEILNIVSALRRAPNKCAVIGPHIIYHGEKYAKTNVFHEKRYVITSGSFINLNLLRKNQICFDEKYFIDKFEVDLDMQFRKKGYKIAEYCGACLYQQLGYNGRNGKTNHSPVRHYYLFRNRFYFNHKWFKPWKRYSLNILQTGRQILHIIKDEDDKVEKLKMLPLALDDYFKGRMGKKV